MLGSTGNTWMKEAPDYHFIQAEQAQNTEKPVAVAYCVIRGRGVDVTLGLGC